MAAVSLLKSKPNPSDEDIIYAVSSKDGKIKGIFIEAFGVYSNGENPVLLLSNQT